MKPSDVHASKETAASWRTVVRLRLPALKLEGKAESVGAATLAAKLVAAVQSAGASNDLPATLTCDVRVEAAKLPTEWSDLDLGTLQIAVAELLMQDATNGTTCLIGLPSISLRLRLEPAGVGRGKSAEDRPESWTTIAELRIADGEFVRGGRHGPASGSQSLKGGYIAAASIATGALLGPIGLSLAASVAKLLGGGRKSDQAASLAASVIAKVSVSAKGMAALQNEELIRVDACGLAGIEERSLSSAEERAVTELTRMMIEGGLHQAVMPLGGATFRLRLVGAGGTDLRRESPGPIASGATEAVVFDAERFRKKMDEELTDLPQDFEGRRTALRAMHEVSRSAIAAAFQEALNRHAQGMPRATYEEKKALVVWMNEELRNLGLAVRCPRTGRDGLLRADPGSANGRFLIDTLDANGRRRTTWTGVDLPSLRLVPDELGRAPRGGAQSR